MKKVIVIGSGILGASAAYHLAKLGAEVILVDRQDKGQATDAAAGIICPWLSQRRNKAWYELAKAGARMYPDLIRELESEGETETGYARVGAISLHHDPDKINKMMERAESRKQEAPEIGEIRRLGEQQTRAQFPLLNKGYQSAYISGAARVDGRALRDALVRSALRNGAALIHGDARLQYEHHKVTGVNVGEHTITADYVVACAGAWAGPLLKPLGVMMNVGFQKAQILHLETPNQLDTGRWPVIIPPTDQYLLAFDAQKIVLGATHENDVQGFDSRATAGGIHEILNKGMEIAPDLENCTFKEVRVGFRPFTPGFLPVIGAVPGWEGIIAANGLGASGLTTGPFLGGQLAKMVLDLPLDIDIRPYDLRHAIEAGVNIDRRD